MDCSVLIVEDELIVAEDLKETLIDWGYDVIGIVPSGRTALHLARESRPDIVVMDVKIDGNMNGVETAVAIRSFFEDEIPIVFISGHSIEKYPLIKALSRSAYLNKPFDPLDLFNAIKTLGLDIAEDKCLPNP